MSKILGIDLGTNSLGTNLWDKYDAGILSEQIESSVDIFKNGVSKGSAKTREASLTAERRSFRTTRNRNRSVRQRKQATLKLLILHGYCPLSMESLNAWRFFDEEEGYNRTFPTDAEFMRWIALDFDGDGRSDYSSAYELRNELITRHYDFNLLTDRYKLGRALYHIACHRGFKSSKGSKAGEETSDNESTGGIQSEINRAKKLEELMLEHGLNTIGQAFYYIEIHGIPDGVGNRVRNSEYTAIRTQYEKEIKEIFTFQGLDLEGEFYHRLISKKKHEGTIFYKKPLTSQKGNIARCFLEPQKPRCYVSHPDFEEFRALQLINNIRVRPSADADWQPLDDTLRQELYTKKFTNAVREYFKFEEIREFLEERLGVTLSKDDRTINFKDTITVSGCPVTVRLRKLFEDTEIHYSKEEIWHICNTAEDEEWVRAFALDTLHLDDKKAKEVLTLWRAMPQGFSNLSLKAIRRILPMLRLGMHYADAVMFAKVPDIIGKERYEGIKDSVLDMADAFAEEFKSQCEEVRTANNALSGYLQNHPEISYRESAQKYLELPNKQQAFCNFLRQQFPDIKPWIWQKLYHHSDVSFYPEPPLSKDGNRYLADPVKGRIMPPAVKHTLYVLRDKMNELIRTGEIDEHTRIVVETAREMCDANTKWALDTYNQRRANEYKEIEKLIKEVCHVESPTETDIEVAHLLLEQGERMNECDEELGRFYQTNVLKDKIKLWKEQNYLSIYTGHYIPFSGLFTEDYDIEHTLPISKSFDDSLANKTICESYYNRKVKGNLLPCQLPNYTESQHLPGFKRDCLSIQDSPVLALWREKVSHLKEQVNRWERKTRSAADEESKNEAMRQKILYQMELHYWEDKLRRFTMTEIDEGFIHSQLNDTRIITRYAYHYLKSVFPKVFVQRGDTTAKFRKILGIEADPDKLDKKQDEALILQQRKDRSMHYHHAIDALVLSLIPHAALRDEILRTYYEIKEAKKQSNRSQVKELNLLLSRKLLEAGISIREVKDAVEKIKTELVVRHERKDNKMAVGSKRRRSKGKPTGEWSRGDVVRGSLHNDSLYGAVKLPVMTDEGPMVKDGRFVYSDVVDGSDIRYVKRKPLSAVKSLSEIVDPLVRKSIEYQMKMYGMKSLESVLTHPMWMMRFKDKHGNKVEEIVKLGKDGRMLSPIRHVRCFTTAQINSNNIPIRATERHSTKQCVNLPDRSHKEKVYAEKGEYIACIVYGGIDSRGKQAYGYHFVTDMMLSADKRENKECAVASHSLPVFLMSLPKYEKKIIGIINKKGEVSERINMSRMRIVTPGMTIRLKDDGTGKSLSERTFIVRNCNYAHKNGSIWVSHHAVANISDTKNMKELSPNTFMSSYEIVE